MVKKVLIFLGLIMLYVVLLLQNGHFILVAYCVPILMVVIALFLFENLSNLKKSLIVLLINIICSTIPICIAYLWKDSGSYVFLAIMTYVFVLVPILIVSFYLFLKR